MFPKLSRRRAVDDRVDTGIREVKYLAEQYEISVKFMSKASKNKVIKDWASVQDEIRQPWQREDGANDE